MKELTVISGVRGYIDSNEVAQLNLEDVARGLGFTTVATSGNDCVRWERVRGYLVDLGFLQEVAKDKLPEFIPENIFYRLAMKAKNEAAEVFQAKVADEILPAIRRKGTYSLPTHSAATDPDDMIIMLAQRNKEIKAQLATVTGELIQHSDQIKQLAAKIETSPSDYFTIVGYASLRGRKVDGPIASKLGKNATRLSGEYGYHVGKIRDPRFGQVNTYHEDILSKVFLAELLL